MNSNTPLGGVGLKAVRGIHRPYTLASLATGDESGVHERRYRHLVKALPTTLEVHVGLHTSTPWAWPPDVAADPEYLGVARCR
jgi:hypothetical protein